VIHPAQSQIWAAIRETDSLQRIAYSVANTFLGRMCISGDVTNLTAAQWDMIDKGMEFYRLITPIIKNGQSFLYGQRNKSDRHPRGWQALIRMQENGNAFALIHTFDGELPEQIEIPLPKGCTSAIGRIYSDTEPDIFAENNTLYYKLDTNWKAVAVLLSLQ
jgi:alpha-galactosidase